nr:uncharacterized protein LOC109164651 [Ipomoea batatas]
MCESWPEHSREQIGIAHHRHLPHGGNHRVPTHHAQAASVILAFHERKAENHQQPYLVECRRGVYPLCPSHQLGGDDAERRRLGREAMAVSAGTIIILDLLRDKYFPQNQQSFPEKHRILRSCLTSSASEDVKDTIGNGEEYRRQFEMVNNQRRRYSCGNVGNKGMPENRAALYAGVLRDRVQRMEYSY